ncbi:MAG: FISUMP domain-containing protein [Salinivirgaceae bacterium]|jgi:uncharacterized protein (TIGR02145 family)|nr:FISUMP domain-containing protein [Salinivirgaceae bacterium]
MKKFTTLLFILAIALSAALSQAPQEFKYQAALRDADGTVMANESVTVDVAILQGSTSGTQVFTESHSVTTTAQGIINLNIGSEADLSTVDWSADDYFIQITVNGTVMGTSQLLSVPYALHAKTAETVSGEITETDPLFTDWDKSTGILVTESQISDLGTYIETETDPIFGASVSSSITGTDTTNWNNKLDTETDPVFTAWDKSTDISVTESQISDLGTYLETETDPVFTTWDKSYNDLSDKPIIADSIAEYGFSGNYDDLTNTPQGTAAGEMRYWDGSQWVNIAPGNDGEILMFNNNTPIWKNYEPGLATVLLGAIFDINGIRAFAEANVTAEGGNAVNERGILWGENANLNVNDDNKITNGSSSGAFTTEINGLAVETEYFVRAYAVNSAGTAYSDETSITTTNGLPIVATNEVTNITYSEATGNGEVIADNGFAVTERGLCWSISPEPTLADTYTASGSGLGAYQATLSNLIPGTTYYVRAYAVNSQGTSYGEGKIFGSSILTDIDGNTYEVVQIGTQVWMAENLKTTTYKDGTSIDLVTDNTAWENNTTGAYSWYNNDEATYADTYGALYNWYAVNTGNLCPSGWHVPTDEEWKTLEIELGMSQAEADDAGYRGTNEGSKLAGNAGLWNYGNLENDSEFGSSGFTALPGGARNYDGTFDGVVNNGGWWSATEDYADGARRRTLVYNLSSVFRGNYYKGSGFSVRCLRD